MVAADGGVVASRRPNLVPKKSFDVVAYIATFKLTPD